MTSGHGTRTEVVVVAAAHRTEAERVVLEGKSSLHTTRLVVQTSHERVAEFSSLYIVYGVAIDVDIVVFCTKGPVFEPCCTETIPHLAGISVAVGANDGQVLRNVVVFTQLRFRKGEGRLVDDSVVGLFVRLRHCRLCESERSIAQGDCCQFKLFLHNRYIC